MKNSITEMKNTPTEHCKPAIMEKKKNHYK